MTGIGLVIFDEFHERSLDTDLGLALTLDVQRALRPDLKVLVMSATLDDRAVAALLGGAPASPCRRDVHTPPASVDDDLRSPSPPFRPIF